MRSNSRQGSGAPDYGQGHNGHRRGQHVNQQNRYQENNYRNDDDNHYRRTNQRINDNDSYYGNGRRDDSDSNYDNYRNSRSQYVNDENTYYGNRQGDYYTERYNEPGNRGLYRDDADDYRSGSRYNEDNNPDAVYPRYEEEDPNRYNRRNPLNDGGTYNDYTPENNSRRMGYSSGQSSYEYDRGRGRNNPGQPFNNDQGYTSRSGRSGYGGRAKKNSGTWHNR